MLTAIRIGNFKVFAETQHIPIRPLTLIYGANSAGKSSIIYSLILAHHILETGDFDASLRTIGGGSVDLGGFKQFVHSRNTDLKVDLEWEVSSHGFSERLSKLLPGVNKATIGVNIGLSGIDHALLEQVSELTPREILQVFIDSAREKGDQTQVEKLESSLKESEDQLTIEELTKMRRCERRTVRTLAWCLRLMPLRAFFRLVSARTW